MSCLTEPVRIHKRQQTFFFLQFCTLSYFNDWFTFPTKPSCKQLRDIQALNYAFKDLHLFEIKCKYTVILLPVHCYEKRNIISLMERQPQRENNKFR